MMSANLREVQTEMENTVRIAILGAGNIGTSIARGLAQAGNFTPGMITLTRRRTHLLEEYKAMGFEVTSDNPAAVKGADVVIVAVEPQRADTLLQEIAPALDFDRHILISVVTGLSLHQNRGGAREAAAHRPGHAEHGHRCAGVDDLPGLQRPGRPGA